MHWEQTKRVLSKPLGGGSYVFLSLANMTKTDFVKYFEKGRFLFNNFYNTNLTINHFLIVETFNRIIHYILNESIGNRCHSGYNLDYHK